MLYFFKQYLPRLLGLRAGQANGKWTGLNANYEEHKDRIATGVMRESWYWLDKETAVRKPLGARVIRVAEADWGKSRVVRQGLAFVC